MLPSETRTKFNLTGQDAADNNQNSNRSRSGKDTSKQGLLRIGQVKRWPLTVTPIPFLTLRSRQFAANNLDNFLRFIEGGSGSTTPQATASFVLGTNSPDIWTISLFRKLSLLLHCYRCRNAFLHCLIIRLFLDHGKMSTPIDTEGAESETENLPSEQNRKGIVELRVAAAGPDISENLEDTVRWEDVAHSKEGR